MKATDAQELSVKYKDADGAYTIKVTKDTSIFYTITGSLVWVRGTNMNPIVHRNVDDWITFSLFKGFKIGGKVVRDDDMSGYDNQRGLTVETTREWVQQLYDVARRDMNAFINDNDDDFAVSVPGAGRFRVNVFKQRGTICAVLRYVPFGLPPFEKADVYGIDDRPCILLNV